MSRKTQTPDRPREHTEQGLRVCRAVGYPYGLSWSLRALGRIALAQESFSEAETYLTEALNTFASIEARAEEARTHLALAELAWARHHRDASAAHLTEACRLSQALAIPTYTHRVEVLARQWGVDPIRA